MSEVNECTYRKGIVALSADPVTFGHLDLIARSKAKCKELVVLVANNDLKLNSYLFTLAERVDMTTRAVREAGITNVRVIGSSGLLVDTYLYEGCDRLFRGVRNAKDLEYEEEQAEINRWILSSVGIEYVEAAEQLRIVSSSMVKALVLRRLDVDRFVPMFVKRALEERLLGQYRLGVTGCIASGKSWVAAQLAKEVRMRGGLASHINVDQLLRDVYDEQSPGAQLVRNALADRFGDGVLLNEGTRIDRRFLAEKLFCRGAEAERQFVTDLTMPHVARMYRAALAEAKGLVLVEWAQMAEMDMSAWTNHNTVVVDSPERQRLIAERGIDPERIAVMDEIQWSAAKKANTLFERLVRDKSGQVMRYDNRWHNRPGEANEDIIMLFFRVNAHFSGLMPEKK